MCKEIKRFLSFVLALALILTTFSSDLASTRVYAVGSVEEMNETTDNTEDGNIFESFSEVNEKSDVDNANEGVEADNTDESVAEATYQMRVLLIRKAQKLLQRKQQKLALKLQVRMLVQ